MYLNPTMGKYLLLPLLEYQATGQYPVSLSQTLPSISSSRILYRVECLGRSRHGLHLPSGYRSQLGSRCIDLCDLLELLYDLANRALFRQTKKCLLRVRNPCFPSMWQLSNQGPCLREWQHDHHGSRLQPALWRHVASHSLRDTTRAVGTISHLKYPLPSRPAFDYRFRRVSTSYSHCFACSQLTEYVCRSLPNQTNLAIKG